MSESVSGLQSFNAAIGSEPRQVTPALLYSRLKMPAGMDVAKGTLSKLFTQGVSYSHGVEMTNMYYGGKLPVPSHMLVTALGVQVADAVHPDDVQAFCTATELRLMLQEKYYVSAIVESLPKQWRGAYWFQFEDSGVHIPPEREFHVSLQAMTGYTLTAAAAGGKGIDLRVILTGPMAWPWR